MPAQRPPQQPVNRARQAPAPGNGAVPRHPPRRPQVPANGPVHHPAPRAAVAPANGGEVRPQPRGAPYKQRQPAVHIPSFVPVLHAPTFRRLLEPPLHSEEFYDGFDHSWDDMTREEYQKLSQDITEVLYADYPKKPNLKRPLQPVSYVQPKY